MKYMLLIYVPSESDSTPEERAAEIPRWMAYTESLQDAGLLVDSHQLHRPDAATTVRLRGGETQITDGPFAETRELLAGYYVLECPDVDVALAHAARAPAAQYGSVEVRPMMEAAAEDAPQPEARVQA
jgi:hypothetical protein